MASAFPALLRFLLLTALLTIAACGGGGGADAPTGIGAPVVVAGAQDPGYQDGSGASVRFRGLAGLAASPDSTLLIADDGNNVLRRMDASGVVSTVATGFLAPNQVAVSAAGEIFVRRSLSRILMTDVVSVSPSGTLSAYVAADGSATALAVDPDGTLYISDGQAVPTLTRVNRDKTKTVLVSGVRVSALTVDPAGAVYFVGYGNLELQFGTVDSAGRVALIATASGNPALAAASQHVINNIAIDDQRNIYFPDGSSFGGWPPAAPCAPLPIFQALRRWVPTTSSSACPCYGARFTRRWETC